MLTVSSFARTYVRNRATLHMVATVAIYRHEDGSFDPVTGMLSSQSGRVIYTGKGRIWYASSGSVTVMGDADIDIIDTYLSIPFATRAVPRRDDVAVVVKSETDPDMVGRAWRIMSADGGGLMNATRKMAMQTMTDSQTWGSFLKFEEAETSVSVVVTATGSVA